MRLKATWCRGELIVFWWPNTSTNIIHSPKKWPNTNTNIIRLPKNDWIRVLFSFPKMTKYEYYSASQKWPNTKIIRLPKMIEYNYEHEYHSVPQNDQKMKKKNLHGTRDPRLLNVMKKLPLFFYWSTFLSSGDEKYKHNQYQSMLHSVCVWHTVAGWLFLRYPRRRCQPKKWTSQIPWDIFAFTFLPDILASSTFFGSYSTQEKIPAVFGLKKYKDE